MTRYRHLGVEIDKCQPIIIVEVGTWNGQHSRDMINRALKFNSEVKYYGFDLFDCDSETREKEKHVKTNATIEQAQANIKSTGADYEIIVGNTHQTLPGFFENREPMDIDFVWLDGGHSLETVENDWNAIAPYLAPNAVVLFDDYYPDKDDVGAKTLVDSLDRTKYKVEILQPADTFGELTVAIAKVTLK